MPNFPYDLLWYSVDTSLLAIVDSSPTLDIVEIDVDTPVAQCMGNISLDIRSIGIRCIDKKEDGITSPLA